MSLTIVKEDGTGKANANSYASITDCAGYHDGHLYAEAWIDAATVAKTAALVMATRLIDAEYEFIGKRTLSGQALQWPRMDCPEPDGTTAQFGAGGGSYIVPLFVIPGGSGQIVVVDGCGYVPGNIVPKAVVEATCELARELLIVDRTAAPAGEGLKFYNDAGVQTGYDKTDKRPVIPAFVQSLLAKYGSLFNARSGAVRLVRV
jgi:hypothetical protein